MMIAKGHEVAHRGYLREYPNEMTRDKERYWTKRGVDALAGITGKRPVGYRAPWYKFSKYSLEILIEEGFNWDCSLMGADVPHLIKCDKDNLTELPGNIQLDDWPQFAHNADPDYMMPIQSPQRAKEVYVVEFEAMWAYNGFWVNCFHPFCSGQVARLMMVRDMISEMNAKGRDAIVFDFGDEADRTSGPLCDVMDRIAPHEERMAQAGADLDRYCVAVRGRFQAPRGRR